jgi:hypothetical protein
MEQLIKVKDNKIQSLVTKLQQAGINWIFFTILFIDKQFFTFLIKISTRPSKYSKKQSKLSSWRPCELSST